MRIGMSGAGRWGRQLLHSFTRFSRVVMCCTGGSPSGRSWLAAHYPDVTWVSDFNAMAASSDIDAVVVASPTPLHAAQAARALTCGKHVFVEKPAALDADATRRLAALAEERDRRLFVGHTFLFDPGVERLSSLTADDPVRVAEFSWRKYGTFGEPLLWTLLPHDVAVALRLFGRLPRSVEARGELMRPERHKAEILLDYGAGAQARILLDRTALTPCKTIALTTVSGRQLEWRSGQLPRLSEQPLDLEVKAFIDSVATGGATVSDGPFAVRVAEVLDRIAASSPVAAPLWDAV